MSIYGSGSKPRSAQHQIHWHWVKGHAGHDMNERADVLAREAIAEIRAAGRVAKS